MTNMPGRNLIFSHAGLGAIIGLPVGEVVTLLPAAPKVFV